MAQAKMTAVGVNFSATILVARKECWHSPTRAVELIEPMLKRVEGRGPSLHRPGALAWVDLSILVALLVIAWAALRLGEFVPQISSGYEEIQDLREVFKECQALFGENSNQAEKIARRKSDVVWHETLLLQAEYSSLAERLQSNLPELDQALKRPSAQTGRAELDRKMQDLKVWIGRQKERASLERLDSRSKELKERIAKAQLVVSNRPVTLASDLGMLLQEIDQTYASYLSDFKQVIINVGKPLVDAFVAQRLDQARKALARLSDLARQARRDGEAIGLFLATPTRPETAKQTRRQEEILHAFWEAGSPAEFARRIRRQTEAGHASPEAGVNGAPSLQAVRRALLATLAGLVIIVMIDLYRRTVVMPLRFKLAERDTIIEHQKKLAHFEQLGAGLAHEVRNPLTTISARLYTVQRKLQEGSPEHNDAMVIGTEIERANQMLKEFILLTRPAPPKLEPMTATPLLNEVRDLMAPQFQREGVRVECQSSGRAKFDGDAQQLKQVLVNLVQNAAQSMDHGGTIILRTRDGRMQLNGTRTNAVVIEVEDNGPGIPPEVQGRLFDPFFSTKKDGTGLGLPISRRIIDRHCGTLDFDTEVGHGTTFRIVLPTHEGG